MIKMGVWGVGVGPVHAFVVLCSPGFSVCLILVMLAFFQPFLKILYYYFSNTFLLLLFHFFSWTQTAYILVHVMYNANAPECSQPLFPLHSSVRTFWWSVLKNHVLSSVVCQPIKVLKESFIPALVSSFFFIGTFGTCHISVFLLEPPTWLYKLNILFSSSISTDHFKIPCNSPNAVVNVRSLVLLGALFLKSWLIFLTPFHVL